MKWLEPIGARIVPANFGPLKAFNAHARIAGDCGDSMEFWLELKDETIRRASYTSDGCETSVACGSVAAHLIQGKEISELKGIRPLDILETMEQSNNEEAHHCADLALRTLEKALNEYRRALQRQDVSRSVVK